MTDKDVKKLDEELKKLEERVERAEIRLEKINLSEVMAKGSKILDLHKNIRELGVVDIYEVQDEIHDIEQRLNKIQYRTSEWLMEDEQTQQALLNPVYRKISQEMQQIGLIALYNEDPRTVIEVVKRTVKEFMESWNIPDQTAYQLVDNVIKNQGYYNHLYTNILTYIKSKEFLSSLVRDVQQLQDKGIGEEMQGMYDMLKEEG